ncbi:hypothetical protein DPMN_019715 [Dreissena polymorpha]|uniref:Uncharacterized protein n=1 Tax=Dreissena polymorpha TaxID=45954 RepID=A0A9D4NHI3_DREPO|nr:hypothetical protein DPMN_019715 [Dreissena polymorpha]
MNVDCTDAVTAVSSTFTQPVLDKPPTFVSGIPGNSPDVSDDNVIATSLGKFTTTDPDTTCSVTLPVTTVYEIRKVASPTDPQKPEFEVWISNAVTQASIDFNDPPVSLTLTIKCTDRNVLNDITGTFNVNIVDSVSCVHVIIGIRVKAGVTLAAAVSPYVMNVDCTDAVTAVSSTFTQPVLDKPPTFVSGIPGNSPDVSDDNVIATSLGKFTTTDPDTTCSVTLPVTTVYEIRKVASPTDPQKPEFEVWISNAVTQASIDFNDPPVSLTLTIKCTDRNVLNDITGTFNVNIVDSPPVFTALPATGTNIFDGLKHATETLHTFSVTDSDDAVNCSARVPENALFEVIAGVASRFTINVKAGVTLRAANGPYVINVDCSDDDNDVTATFTQPVIDTPPSFVSGIPGSSPNVSDSTVTQMLLGKFTTTDPDTACSVTSPSTTVYEIRNVTSPVNVSQPEFEVRISSTVTEAAIDFNDQAVPLTLTIRCTDGNPVNVITGTFNVNIVDEDPVLTSFPMTSY